MGPSKTKSDMLEVVRGSGNVFADFGHPDAALLHPKTHLAAQVIKAPNEDGLSTQA